MNLKHLSKKDLDQRIRTLAAKERELLLEVLLTIKEIDQRRSFLELGYANLFAYLTEGVGYSAGSAHRRIEAARLLHTSPSVGAKIRSGAISLTQIALLQKTSRQVFKKTSKKVSPAEKEILISQLENKTYPDSQKEIAAYFDLPILQGITLQVQADESVRAELTIPRSLYEKIQHAQALLSHALTDKDLVSYLEYVTDQVIKQKTSVRPPRSAKSTSTVEVPSADERTKNVKTEQAPVNPPSTLETLPQDPPNKKSHPSDFSLRDKKLILKEQVCCQYRDPHTQRQCQSRWFLQVDHKQSRWAAGPGKIENSQILCGAHNRMKYRKENRVEFK